MASIVEILINIKNNATEALTNLADGLSGAKAAGSGLSGILTEITAVLGLGALGGAVANAVEVWAQWQQSVVELNAALSLTGQYSEAASAQIQGMAEYIQNVTAVSKQSAIGVSDMAAAFTHLQPTQLAALQKAAVGFQAVFGGGMEHAASLFSRSLEGSGVVLRRYGVDIDSTMSESERFSEIMGRFGPMFNIAESAADTLSGRFLQMMNQFQDLERTIGDVLTRILGLQGGLEGTKSIVESVNDWIKDHGMAIVTYGQRFVAVIAALIEVVPALFTVVIDKAAPLFATISSWVDKLEGIAKAIKDALLVMMGGATTVIGDALVNALKKSDGAVDETAKHVTALQDAFTKVGKAIDDLDKPLPAALQGGRVGTVTPGAGAETNLPTPI